MLKRFADFSGAHVEVVTTTGKCYKSRVIDLFEKQSSIFEIGQNTINNMARHSNDIHTVEIPKRMGNANSRANNNEEGIKRK
jgi:hypothetical protein